MDDKQAFKVGFVLKLAEHGLSVTDLMDMVRLLPAMKTAAVTWVPKDDLDSVRKHGLLSSEAALSNADVLSQIANRRGVKPETLKKRIQQRLKSWHSPSSRGVNALFALPPDTVALPDHHPSKALNAVPLRLKLTEMLKDMPDTVVHGQELVPYSEEDDRELGDSYADLRHRDLSKKELTKLLATPNTALWKHFDPKSKLYAADVPHMSVRTPTGVIDPKYIEGLEVQEEGGSSGAAKTAAPTALLGAGVTGLGLSIAGPMHAGTAAGGVAGKLMDSEVDDLDTARKKYLLKRYQDLINSRRAQLSNRAISQAMREVR